VGVQFEHAQPVGADAAEELLKAMETDDAEELLKAMETDDAELLVVGIRHRRPVGKLLLGSVSQLVLLECPKPVLAVKPTDLEQEVSDEEQGRGEPERLAAEPEFFIHAHALTPVSRQVTA
jgi:hypothetical protein